MNGYRDDDRCIVGGMYYISTVMLHQLDGEQSTIVGVYVHLPVVVAGAFDERQNE